MKWFCECNSEWETEQSDDLRFRYQSPSFKDETDPSHKCSVCKYYKWREPHYENMMYDLRDMNR